MILEKFVIWDIETFHPNNDVRVDNAQLRYVGFRHHEGKNICLHYTEKSKIQEIINFFPYIIGHNILEFDKPILENNGFVFNNNIVIDTLQISENRLKSMLYLDLNKGDKSLEKLCERFNLKHKKGAFDYSLLEKDKLSGEEYNLLEEYLFGDLEATEDLFKYYYEMFFPFREYVNEKNKQRLSWLTCKSGTTAYKCITNMAGLPEEYNDDTEDDGEKYAGGYVSEPTVDFVEGDIYVADFASLYPSLMIGFNLFSQTDKDFFKGSEIYPTIYGNEIDGIKGRYGRQNGNIENTIKSLYVKKLSIDMKLKTCVDEQEKTQLQRERLVVKILANSCYGVLGSPKFKSIYNKTSASDCTALARRSIKHARTVLEEMGYICQYTDTDSVYFVDPHKNRQRVEEVLNYISTVQRQAMNVKNEYHKFVLENKIKRIYFFRDDKGNFVKKKYIYVDENDKIKEKGIMVVKGNCSKIAKEFYTQVIKQKIANNTFTLYDPNVLLKELKDFSIGKEDLLQKRYRVSAPETYKVPDGKDEANSLSYQIAKRYNAGEHQMVINKRIGVGKGNRYCKIEELKEKYGDEWINQVCFEEYMSDLSEFIDYKLRNKIHFTDRKINRKKVLQWEHLIQ